MADSYVCSGAIMKCTMGSSPAKLTVLPSRTVDLAGQPQANISDHKTMVNLGAFGLCRSMGFPATASATAAAHGHLTPMPCMHNTPVPWMGGKMDTLIKGQPALLKSSTCMCMWGGTISLVTNGQMGEGAKGVNEELLGKQRLREIVDSYMPPYENNGESQQEIREDEAATLAKDCYNSEKNPVEGWNVLEVYDDKGTGFHAKLYEKNGNYVFATAGTDPKSLKDWGTNFSQQLGIETAQYEQSIAIAKDLAKKHNNLTFIGHSLGGGLASANSRATGLNAITFNPSALSKRYSANLYNSKITAYVSEGDILDFVNRVILRQEPEGVIIRRPVAATVNPVILPGSIPAQIISALINGVRAHTDIVPIF